MPLEVVGLSIPTGPSALSNTDTHTQTHTHRHRHTQRDTHTHTHRHTHTHTHTPQHLPVNCQGDQHESRVTVILAGK